MASYGWLRDVLTKWREEGKIEKVKQLSDYANTKLNCSVGQLAIAWVIKNKNVSTVLLGATKPSQLEENFGAIEVAR
jgi:aryl-alcohol dehydrogenase-like predicted oxidoreductase